MKIYRERKKLIRHSLSGATLLYISIDNIISGPLRETLSSYFDLKEFGSNVREEYLYYLLLFLGLFQIIVTLQGLILPLVEVVNDKLVLRTRERLLSVVKDLVELKALNLRDDNFLEFIFSDKVFTVYVKDVSNSNLQEFLNNLQPREK